MSNIPLILRKFFRRSYPHSHLMIPHSIIQLVSRGLIVAVGIVWAASGNAAKNDDKSYGSDAIISEKDAVDLVEDSSVREAISRRPDLSFANVTIDGEDSRQSLDSISADSVTSVEVMKAVTPDQDADSRGGSISLKTRPAYQQKSVSTKVGLEAKYDSLDGHLGKGLEFSVGGAINKDRTLGGRLSLSIDKDFDDAQYIVKDWYRRTIDGESRHAIKEMRMYDLNEWIDRRQGSAALDLKVSDSLRLYWRGSYRETEIREDRPHFKYRFNKGTFVSVDESGAESIGAEIERGYHAYAYDFSLLETSVGGEWLHDDWEADFKYTIQDENLEPLYHSNFDFVMSDVDLRYDLTNARLPEVTITNGMDFNDLEAYEFEDVSVRDRSSSESDQIAALNLKRKRLFGNERINIRFGAKSRDRDNAIDYESTYYDAYLGPGAFSVADVVSADEGIDYLHGRYRLDHLIDGAKVNAFLTENLDSFSYDERRSRERSDPSTYQVDERVDGLYGMIDFEVGKWRGIVGARQENTSITFESNEVLLGPDTNDKDGDGDFDETVYLETRPTEGDTSYDHFFPNSHFRYKWNDRITLIASYTNTIKRPPYGEVVPYRHVRLEDREVEEGNPGLSPTLYENLDLSMDLKMGDSGLFSVELFDRTIEDALFSRQSFVEGGIYDGFERQRIENGPSGFARGVSFTWNQPFAMPLAPEGFSFNANFEASETEIEYPFRPGERLPLTRSPESELQLALKYERAKLFAQLKWDRESESIYRIGNRPSEDRYVGPNGDFDLSVSYKVQPKTRLYFEWRNLTNEPVYDYYIGDPSRPNYYRIRPWTLNTGVKIEL